LTCQRTFAKEISSTKHAKGRFSPSGGHDRKFYFAFLDIEDRVRRISLGEDRLLIGESQVLPSLANGVEEGVGIESAARAREPRGSHQS
jgi:hypothetical protein